MTATTPSADHRHRARKFPCEQCGADVAWDPASAALKCGHCGFSRLVAVSGTIAEKPVEGALRKPRDLGWGAERKVVACKRCGAHTTLDPHLSASQCAFCGANAVVETTPGANVVRPEGLIAFKVPKETALGQFRNWVSNLWFRPSDLKTRSRVTGVQGAYIPFWIFDAATWSEWTAEAGYYYYVTVQVQENGRTVSKQERRTRWEPASGSLNKAFDDVPVPASRGIDAALCQEIEPFPTASLTPYNPSFLAGFLAEENAIDLDEALGAAKERMAREIRSACAAEVPGDTHRNLDVHTTWSALAYKNALLPIWIAAYEYAARPYRYIVNGVTGKATGTAPWSWFKIGFALLAVLAIVLTIVALNQ